MDEALGFGRKRKEKAMDRISELPDFMLHHILSFLEPEEAARAAVLSKFWSSVWLTYPNLTFNFDPYPVNREEKIAQYAKNTISRFTNSELRVNCFSLKGCSKYPSVIEESIKFAVLKDVKFLDLNFFRMKELYTLPETIFAAKSLVELKLSACDFHSINLSCATKIDFRRNLKKVVFRSVILHDWVVDMLISNSPLIEEIELLECEPILAELRVSNVPKLKRFNMFNSSNCPLVEIDAPSLESFKYIGGTTIPNIDACRNLKQLILDMTNKKFDKSFSFSNFPFLEDLDMDVNRHLWNVSSMGWETLMISSQSLKRITLRASPECTKEVMIDAPNLLLLKYRGSSLNSITLRYPPKQLEVDLSMLRVLDQELSSWFHRLREVLVKRYNGTKVFLSLDVPDFHHSRFESKELEKLPKPEVEHLELTLFSTSTIYLQAVMDGLSWSCHPKVISIKQYGFRHDNFRQSLQKNIIDRFRFDLGCFNGANT